MSTMEFRQQRAKSLPAVIATIAIGAACSALLMSKGAQPDISWVDTGISLVNFVAAYAVADLVAERAGDYVISKQPGLGNRLLGGPLGSVLTKIAAGKWARTLVPALVMGAGVMVSKPLTTDMTNVAHWGVGMLSAGVLAGTLGLIGIAKGALDDKAFDAASTPRRSGGPR